MVEQSREHREPSSPKPNPPPPLAPLREDPSLEHWVPFEKAGEPEVFHETPIPSPSKANE